MKLEKEELSFPTVYFSNHTENYQGVLITFIYLKIGEEQVLLFKGGLCYFLEFLKENVHFYRKLSKNKIILSQ